MKNKVNEVICKSKKAELVESLIVLAVVLIINSWFLIVKGSSYIDSDMASNFLAAVVNYSEGVFLSENWYYSTGVQIFSDTCIYQLVYLFIKDNWILARAVGIIILQLMLVASFIWVSCECGFSRTKSILFAAFTVFPASYWLLLMLSFGGYYLSNTILSLITLSLSLWFIKLGDKKLYKVICIVLTVVIGIITGVNGIKGVIYPYGPIAVTAAVILFLTVREDVTKIKDFSCEAWKYFTSAIIGCVSFGVGFLISLTVMESKFYYESKDNIIWAPFNINSFGDGISECLSLLGYQSDSHVNWLSLNRTTRTVFSLQGIANLFGILLICFLIFSVVRLTVRYKKLGFTERMLLVFFYSSIFVGCLIFKFTEGYDTSAVYWVPFYPLMLIIMIMEIKTEEYKFNVTPHIVTLAITICMIITSFSTLKLYQESPLYANPQLVNVVKWLENQGYTQGYASFWQSNSVTFLSNGRIDMWNVYGFDNLQIQPWLQKMSHNMPPEGDRIFALIGPNDELDREVFLQYMDTTPGTPEIVYADDEGYIVVEYN